MTLPAHWWRGPVWAFAIALTAAFAIYGLGYAMGNGLRFAVVGFLIVLPACLCAFVGALADPGGAWRFETYCRIPFLLLACVTVGAALFLREGLICIVILAIPWIGAGLLGLVLFYKLRHRVEGQRFHAMGFLVVPLLAIQAENAFPAAWQDHAVAREIIIAAPPERVWPTLLSLPDIASTEGRWTISHDLLSVPRPHSAQLREVGGRVVRFARWQDDVRFAEAISRVEPGRTLDWRFLFPDPTLHHRVDRHIDPRGPMLDVSHGGYRLSRTAHGGTRLVLTTHYRLRTWGAPYAVWWGERILGDIQRNILTVIADRAEARRI